MDNSSVIDTEGSHDVIFDNLYPVLFQTFVVIVLGYLSGRWGIIGSVEAKGLNVFVGHFALPCVIFKALAEMDFSRVNWMFLLSILISKLTVFVVVLVFTLLVTRPMDLSKAGLFAIFCTQSNDFALGYPIVAAVYGESHPEYAKYLYVMAPISLVLLNPIGFLCLELGARRKENQRAALVHSSYANLNESGSTMSISSAGSASNRSRRLKLMVSVWKNMLFTPIVLMTFLGIAVNFLFQHQIPFILCGVLSSAFSATALFALGLRMVGKMQSLRGSQLVVPGILIGVKCLVMPIVTREVTIHLGPGDSGNSSLDLSNLGFLLGTFPSAPGVFFYAVQYNTAADLIATAMVACTFVSAPLTFVSARMVSLARANPADYIELLDRYLVHVAIVGLVCTLFVLAIFVAGKKWTKIPHFATLSLTFSQLMACAGVVMWYTVDRDEQWKKHLQFVLFVVGVFGSRIWSALLSVTLLLLRMKSLAFVLNARPALMFVGWGIPVLLAAVIPLSADTVGVEKENPNFQYGKTQALAATSVLMISFTVTLICLVLQQRCKRKPVLTQSNSLTSFASLDNSLSEWSPKNRSLERNSVVSMNSVYHQPLTRSSSMLLEAYCGDYYQTSDPDGLFSPSDNLPTYVVDLRPTLQALQSKGKLNTNHLTEPEENSIVRDRDDEFQIMRHVILLLAMGCSMFVGIALCVWTLVMEELTGIYVMLLFLDETLNFGQGVFVLVVFGLEPKRFLTPVWTGLRRQMKPGALQASSSQNEQQVANDCDQFLTFYHDKCIRDLVRDRKWHLKQYTNVFCGNELVDWLLLMGLSSDRSQAERYGQTLLKGDVICHVDGRKGFHDQPYFYAFKV